MMKAYLCNCLPNVAVIIWLTLVGVCSAQQPTAAIKDLSVPNLEIADPTAGKRVKQQLKSYEETDVYHVVYLPTDWEPGKSYPIIAEFPGNRYRTRKGLVDECVLGFGITKGEGAIWVSLPFVNVENGINQDLWWGDVNATARYAEKVLDEMVNQFGGDQERIVLAGFSRGSIACNFIGLHDDQIASRWCGFVCHSHYDGVKRWKYAGGDEDSALERLERLKGRPQFVCHEKSVGETRAYLERVQPEADIVFCELKGWGHTDQWVLYDVPERSKLRDWYDELVAKNVEDRE